MGATIRTAVSHDLCHLGTLRLCDGRVCSPPERAVGLVLCGGATRAGGGVCVDVLGSQAHCCGNAAGTAMDGR